MAPRKALGSLPPSGNPKVPMPPIRFEEVEGHKATSASSAPAPAPAQRKRRSGLPSFLGSFLIRIFALYTAIAALFTCSTHPFQFDYSAKDSRAVCRSLAHGKTHLVPRVTPWLHSAHHKVSPYTRPYVDAVTPYSRAAWKTARPYYRQAQKQGKVVYNRHLEPMRKKAIKRGRGYTDPHVKAFNKQYERTVQPHINNLNKAVQPYQDIYSRDVAPYLSQAYTHSLAAGSASYVFYVKQVHPHVVTSLQQLHSFYINHADPAMRRAYSLYVRPQMDRVLAKVFERKAHGVGSEAISEAKQEVKEAKKEGKARSKEWADEAEKEAIRKKEEPSVVEQAQQATESLLGVNNKEGNEVEVARLDAELDAELEKVQEQLEAWESGMTKLIAQEYKLFTERISELRNRRLADLPDHFASMTERSAEDEVAAILTRLERVYRKLGKSDLAVGEQVAEANKQHGIHKAKLGKLEASFQAQIEGYATDLEKDEVKSLEASAGELRRFVKEAQRSYARIMDEAKFLRSVEDYEGWGNGMMQRAKMFETDLLDLLKGGKILGGMGAVDLRKEPTLDSHIADLQSRAKKLYSTANSQLDSYVTSGNMQLRGEGALAAISDATDAVAEQAKGLAEGAASSMLVAALAARQKLGLAPKESPGILDRVQESLQAATQSVASVVGATPSAKSAGDYVDSVATAVGYKSEPESLVGVIGNNAQEVMDGAASVAGSAAQRASDAFTAATTSAGNEARTAVDYITDSVMPTSLGVEAVVGVAQEQFASLSHSASQVAESAGSLGFSVMDQVSEGVAETGKSGVEQGSHAAQDIYQTVKGGVESAGEAISQGSAAVREAVMESTSGEDDKLVGKPAKDKDFNTVGKAAEGLKDRIAHIEL